MVQQGVNSIDIKNLGEVLGPVFRQKLGQTFWDASICFQVDHTDILFNLTSRAKMYIDFCLGPRLQGTIQN